MSTGRPNQPDESSSSPKIIKSKAERPIDEFINTEYAFRVKIRLFSQLLFKYKTLLGVPNEFIDVYKRVGDVDAKKLPDSLPEKIKVIEEYLDPNNFNELIKYDGIKEATLKASQLNKLFLEFEQLYPNEYQEIYDEFCKSIKMHLPEKERPDSLRGLIAMPYQRMPRYVLLLKELVELVTNDNSFTDDFKSKLNKSIEKEAKGNLNIAKGHVVSAVSDLDQSVPDLATSTRLTRLGNSEALILRTLAQLVLYVESKKDANVDKNEYYDKQIDEIKKAIISVRKNEYDTHSDDVKTVTNQYLTILTEMSDHLSQSRWSGVTGVVRQQTKESQVNQIVSELKNALGYSIDASNTRGALFASNDTEKQFKLKLDSMLNNAREKNKGKSKEKESSSIETELDQLEQDAAKDALAQAGYREFILNNFDEIKENKKLKNRVFTGYADLVKKVGDSITAGIAPDFLKIQDEIDNMVMFKDFDDRDETYKALPNLSNLTQIFNKLGSYVINDIVDKVNINDAILAYEFWLGVAHYKAFSSDVRDYQQVFAIFLTITNNNIVDSILSRARNAGISLLSENSVRQLEDLRNLTSEKWNYKVLKDQYNANKLSNIPYIPFTGLIGKDLVISYTADKNTFKQKDDKEKELSKDQKTVSVYLKEVVRSLSSFNNLQSNVGYEKIKNTNIITDSMQSAWIKDKTDKIVARGEAADSIKNRIKPNLSVIQKTNKEYIKKAGITKAVLHTLETQYEDEKKSLSSDDLSKLKSILKGVKNLKANFSNYDLNSNLTDSYTGMDEVNTHWSNIEMTVDKASELDKFLSGITSDPQITTYDDLLAKLQSIVTSNHISNNFLVSLEGNKPEEKTYNELLKRLQSAVLSFKQGKTVLERYLKILDDQSAQKLEDDYNAILSQLDGFKNTKSIMAYLMKEMTFQLGGKGFKITDRHSYINRLSDLLSIKTPRNVESLQGSETLTTASSSAASSPDSLNRDSDGEDVSKESTPSEKNVPVKEKLSADLESLADKLARESLDKDKNVSPQVSSAEKNAENQSVWGRFVSFVSSVFAKKMPEEKEPVSSSSIPASSKPIKSGSSSVQNVKGGVAVASPLASTTVIQPEAFLSYQNGLTKFKKTVDDALNALSRFSKGKSKAKSVSDGLDDDSESLDRLDKKINEVTDWFNKKVNYDPQAINSVAKAEQMKDNAVDEITKLVQHVSQDKGLQSKFIGEVISQLGDITRYFNNITSVPDPLVKELANTINKENVVPVVTAAVTPRGSQEEVKVIVLDHASLLPLKTETLKALDSLKTFINNKGKEKASSGRSGDANDILSKQNKFVDDAIADINKVNIKTNDIKVVDEVINTYLNIIQTLKDKVKDDRKDRKGIVKSVVSLGFASSVFDKKIDALSTIVSSFRSSYKVNPLLLAKFNTIERKTTGKERGKTLERVMSVKEQNRRTTIVMQPQKDPDLKIIEPSSSAATSIKSSAHEDKVEGQQNVAPTELGKVVIDALAEDLQKYAARFTAMADKSRQLAADNAVVINKPDEVLKAMHNVYAFLYPKDREIEIPQDVNSLQAKSLYQWQYELFTLMSKKINENYIDELKGFNSNAEVRGYADAVASYLQPGVDELEKALNVELKESVKESVEKQAEESLKDESALLKQIYNDPDDIDGLFDAFPDLDEEVRKLDENEDKFDKEAAAKLAAQQEFIKSTPIHSAASSKRSSVSSESDASSTKSNTDDTLSNKSDNGVLRPRSSSESEKSSKKSSQTTSARRRFSQGDAYDALNKSALFSYKNKQADLDRQDKLDKQEKVLKEFVKSTNDLSGKLVNLNKILSNVGFIRQHKSALDKVIMPRIGPRV